jgi:hypothetical protein
MSVLDELDWRSVREQYEVRLHVHERFVRLLNAAESRAWFDLALGISDAAGNYSASEHRLGPRVRAENSNADSRLRDLARSFMQLSSARNVPELIRAAGLKYVGIGAGSEVSCMSNPTVCWVANTRTIWTHLVIKHVDNFDRANEELNLYRDADVSSEMNYAAWSEIHALLETALSRIAEEGSARAQQSQIVPGDIKYLWADAIANAIYEAHSPRARSWRSY